MWVGLRNPDGINCNTRWSCSGRLEFSDGSLFTNGGWVTISVRADEFDCIRMTSSFNILRADDSSCTARFEAHLCHMTCEGEGAGQPAAGQNRQK